MFLCDDDDDDDDDDNGDYAADENRDVGFDNSDENFAFKAINMVLIL